MTDTFPSIPTNPESWLPLSSGGREHCHACGNRVETHHVTDPWAHWRPICRPCIAALPGRTPLLVWADLADVHNQLDRFFEDVPDVGQRQVFLDLIAHQATWMANWRWPDDKVIAIQAPVSDDEPDDEDE